MQKNVPPSMMNSINVPIQDSPQGHRQAQAVLEELAKSLDELTPQTRKAATYMLEAPEEIGVSSIHELAAAASVKPNTLVRLARAMGFDGYDELRTPFRNRLKNRNLDFPDRARWLQSLSREGKLGGLYPEMAASAITNIEATFSQSRATDLKKAAEIISKARRTYVLGVGVYHAVARNFSYLASMVYENIKVAPSEGGNVLDDLAKVGARDVVLAMTFKPYRREIVDAVQQAEKQGAKIIGISDSAASPIITISKIGFVVSSETPQFFPSTVATLAMLETLTAFLVAEADDKVVQEIRHRHVRRSELGLYVNELEA